MSRAIVVGLFVFGALIILIAAVFLIGRKELLFSETFELRTEFPNVAGLAPGSEVRIGGLRKGTVKAIRLPESPGENVTVILSVERDTRNLIRRDSVAGIATEGLLGSKHVSISFGSSAAEPVQDGDTLRSVTPTDYSDLIDRANKVIEQTGEALDEAKTALRTVTRIGSDIESVVEKIDRGEGTIGALVNDRTLYNQANQILANAEKTTRTIDSAAEDLSKRASAVIDDAQAAVQDIRRATSEVAANTGPVIEEARQGLGAFNENMQALKRNWFFRGFFRDRGYFNFEDLTTSEITDVPKDPARRFVIDADDLFDEPDTAELKKKDKLEEIGRLIESSSPGLVVVTAYTDPKGAAEENLDITRAQAGVVRRFFIDNFIVDEDAIRTKGFGENAAARKGQIEILMYSSQPDIRQTQ